MTRLQPRPEPPWLGPHPGLPSAPPDSEDDSSPLSEEQTHNLHHDTCLMDEDKSEEILFKIRTLFFFLMKAYLI